MTNSTTTAADQHAWTRWMRDAAQVASLPEPWSPAGRRLTRGAERLLRGSALPTPTLITVPDRHAASISVAGREALAELESHGGRDGDKFNVGVGAAGSTLVDEIDVPHLVLLASGLHVAQPTTATYVGYLQPGQRLELHLDLHGFGDLMFLLCLIHDPAPGSRSETVLVTADAQLAYGMEPGEALLFDGTRTPHGRTPVASSERVVSIALGLNLLDPQSAPMAPAVDEPTG